MNGIERVTNVLNGQPVDRVPLGFYLVDCDTIANVIGRKTYVRNKIDTQIALWEGRRDEVAQSCKQDTVDFFRRIDLCDIITFKEAAILPPKDYQPTKARKINDDTWEDEHGRVFKQSRISNEFVCVKDPALDAKQYTLDDFPPTVEPKTLDPSIFEASDHLIQQLGAERFILGTASHIAMPRIGGMERGLMEYVMNPDLVRAAVKHYVADGNAYDRQYIRPGQHGVLIEEDYGTTRAPMISPQMFREFCFPAMKVRTDHIKQFDQRVFLHSCGNTWPLIDMFIDAGIECYQSLQTGAGMDIDKLQETFAGRIAFWGGLAVEILVKGTPDEVRQNVRQAVDVAKRGGVVLGPSHSIAYGVPYENFMAMLDEFQKTAAY